MSTILVLSVEYTGYTSPFRVFVAPSISSTLSEYLFVAAVCLVMPAWAGDKLTQDVAGAPLPKPATIGTATSSANHTRCPHEDMMRLGVTRRCVAFRRKRDGERRYYNAVGCSASDVTNVRAVTWRDRSFNR